MDNKQEIVSLRKKFALKKRFTKAEFVSFLQDCHAGLSDTAINWRIHQFKNQHVVTSLGKGFYQITKDQKPKEEFSIKVSPVQKKICESIKNRFPIVQFCIWPVRCVHEFMTHIPAVDWTLIEVEKGVSESVYSWLRQARHDVYINPDKAMMDRYVAFDRKAVIIKDLISQAPLNLHSIVPIPTIEKILVDLIVDKVVFDIYQGAELKNIYAETLHKYRVSISRMKRYATRRNSWEEVSNLLDDAVG